MDCSKRNILYDSECCANKSRTFLTQHGIKYMRAYTLNVNNQKELRSMLPNFQLKVFHKQTKVKLSAQNYQNELIFYPYNYYSSSGQVGYPVMRFEGVSPANKKYKEWLDTDNRIFIKPYIKKYQSRLSIVKNCLIKMF